jgi:hypothetical protein
MIQLLLSAVLFTSPQGGAAQQAPPFERSPASAEGLRTRVHDMRMNLLLGGDQVRRAESEAVEFYSRQLELVDRRLDVVQSDLRVQRSTYDHKLDQALSVREPTRRDAIMREAHASRGAISRLESEAAALTDRRGRLSSLVGSVQARDRERESLVAQLDASGEVEMGFGLPFAGIGLAPASATREVSASPFDDPALLSDLLSRDERAARRLMFESDPRRYWSQFSLRPPVGPLRAALDFPMPDLPGAR